MFGGSNIPKSRILELADYPWSIITREVIANNYFEIGKSLPENRLDGV